MIRKVISIVLIAALLLGAVVIFVGITNKKTKRIYPSFGVGCIDTDNVSFKESKTDIYTKEFIECKGLSITPTFDNKALYKIYFYDESDNYVGSVSKNAQESFKSNQIPDGAVKCRIVITPAETAADDEDNGFVILDVLEFGTEGIQFYETFKYSSKFEIRVNKVQKSSSSS